MDRPAAPPRAGLTESLSRLRDRNRAACASNPPRPAHGDENAPAQESVRASEKHPAERASSFGDAVSARERPAGPRRRARASPRSRRSARSPVPRPADAPSRPRPRAMERASSSPPRITRARRRPTETRKTPPKSHPPPSVASPPSPSPTSGANSTDTTPAPNVPNPPRRRTRPPPSPPPRRRTHPPPSPPLARAEPPLAPKEPTPVIIVTARGPPGAPSSASCSPSPDGGAVLTLARPKTSITRSFRIGARVDSSRAARFVSRGNRAKDDADDADGIVGTFGGFDAMAAEAATRGIRCARSSGSARRGVPSRARFGATTDSGRRWIRGEGPIADLDVLASNLGACGARRGHSVRRRRARSTGRRRRGTNLRRAGLADVVACPRRLRRVRRHLEGRRTRCSATSSPKDSTR